MAEKRPFLRTSPSGPRKASGAVVQVGYDEIVEETTISAGSGIDAFVPRNVAQDPLEVIFPTFTLGNTLEVDFRMSAEETGGDPGGNEVVATVVVISIDGGTTWYFIDQSRSEQAVDASIDISSLSLSSLNGIKIVDPMPAVVSGVPTTVPVTAPPRVRVTYVVSVALTVGSNDATVPGCTLKCTELDTAAVFQGPLGTLSIPA